VEQITSFTTNLGRLVERQGEVGKVAALYSGRSWFVFRPGNTLLWLKIFIVSPLKEAAGF
jgi:hypothetical protein